MAKVSAKYEVLYIINPNLAEDETAALVEKFRCWCYRGNESF